MSGREGNGRVVVSRLHDCFLVLVFVLSATALIYLSLTSSPPPSYTPEMAQGYEGGTVFFEILAAFVAVLSLNQMLRKWWGAQ